MDSKKTKHFDSYISNIPISSDNKPVINECENHSLNKTYSRAKIRDKFTDTDLKRIYGIAIISVLGLWVIFVIVFMFFQMSPCNRLSDNILITLLTTTTANILFLPGFVLKYLFPNSNKK